MKKDSDDMLEKCRRILRGALSAPSDQQIAEMQRRGLIDEHGHVLIKGADGNQDRPAR
jgi:hypothetical protein